MTSYSYAAPIDLSADVVFDYLAEVRNLPDYFPQLTRATPQGGDAVSVEAEVDGKAVAAEAWLHVDRTERTLNWSAQNENGYHGQLQVTERGAGLCDLAITLHTEHADGPDVQKVLEQTVAGLSQIIARQQDAEDGTHPAGDTSVPNR